MGTIQPGHCQPEKEAAVQSRRLASSFYPLAPSRERRVIRGRLRGHIGGAFPTLQKLYPHQSQPLTFFRLFPRNFFRPPHHVFTSSRFNSHPRCRLPSCRLRLDRNGSPKAPLWLFPGSEKDPNGIRFGSDRDPKRIRFSTSTIPTTTACPKAYKLPPHPQPSFSPFPFSHIATSLYHPRIGPYVISNGPISHIPLRSTAIHQYPK
jgi:hypothetical protein